MRPEIARQLVDRMGDFRARIANEKRGMGLGHAGQRRCRDKHHAIADSEGAGVTRPVNFPALSVTSVVRGQSHAR